MGIPNEKALYTEDNLIYGEHKVSRNSKSQSYRPSSNRGNHVVKMLAYTLGEKILRTSPTASSDTVLGGIYNSLRSGLIQSFNAGKHVHGQEAFKNNIPGLKKVIQNLYSFYQLKSGVTTLDEAYTVDWDGKEYMLALHGERDVPLDNSLLNAISSQIVGNKYLSKRHSETTKGAIQGRKYRYTDAVNAGVYAELIDGDIFAKKLLDIAEVPPIYQMAELALFGAKGKKTVVDTGTANGKNYTIYRYGKPATADYWRFYAELDLLYSATGITAGAAERILKGVGGQRVYLEEMNNVVNSALKRYGGNLNPLSFNYQY